MKKTCLSLLAILACFFTVSSQDKQNTLDDYIRSRTHDINGREIVEIIVPGKPPDHHREPVAIPSRSSVLLTNVPAFSWSFGCSATAAAMAAGYFDNSGYPNMYDGPTHGGVMPMNNSSWGTVVINGENQAQCPLSATRNTVDGRTSRGHVDDYWIIYNSGNPDPYITNGWTEHNYGDCTGDYMGTNQSDIANIDGGTTFYYATNGSPLYNYTGSEPARKDGCHGMREFYESRDYVVVQNYSQYIYGYNGNTLGFTFDQYKTEIDNGRPVLIQVTGHTMLGYGYNDSDNTVYLHDTWDYASHTMTWGGTYSNPPLQHYGVTVVQLQGSTLGPVANFMADDLDPNINSIVNFTDLTTGYYGYTEPDSWSWSFDPSTVTYFDGTSSTSENPHIQFNAGGLYTVSLTVSNGSENDTKTRTDYINVYYCPAYILPLTEDFSDGAIPTCWSMIDHEGNGQVWAFNNPGGVTVNTATAANGFAILNSDYYGSGNSQNCDLITPKMDLSAALGVILNFQHYFLSYAGSSATLSYSIDDGNTWTVLQTWTTTTANPAIFSQDVSSLVAGQSGVKFKWNYTGTWGYYWAVDDIDINTNFPGLWTGAVSGDWNLPANWSDGIVPAASTNVLVHALAFNWPVFSGDLTIGTTCGNLTLMDNAQMSVTGDLTIPIGKSLVFNGAGQINIGGDWNKYGTFTPGTGNLAFDGNSTASLYSENITSNSVTDYTRSTFTFGMTTLPTGSSSGPTGTNQYKNVPLGFSFIYIGNAYDSARLTTNGYISLNKTGTSSSANANLFLTTIPNASLAPWWDALKADATTSIRYRTEGTAPDRVFTAEWYRILSYASTATTRLKFQVKLYESTRVIEYCYGTIENGVHHTSESASIGLEDATGGTNHFIEGTTGSMTDGITTLKSPDNWPPTNYRFTPATQDATFHNITINKTGGAILNINCSINLSGALTVQPGASLKVQSGKTIKVQGTTGY